MSAPRFRAGMDRQAAPHRRGPEHAGGHAPPQGQLMENHPRPLRAQGLEDRRLLAELVALGLLEKRRRPDGRRGYWPTTALDGALAELPPAERAKLDLPPLRPGPSVPSPRLASAPSGTEPEPATARTMEPSAPIPSLSLSQCSALCAGTAQLGPTEPHDAPFRPISAPHAVPVPGESHRPLPFSPRTRL
jgi:hypothetical protein